MKVVVASKNPVKINATRQAFVKMFPDVSFEVLGVGALSGISNQPIGDEETKMGSINRIRHARELVPDADWWVAMEGGIERDENEKLRAFAWFVIEDAEERRGTARAATFSLPAAITSLINEGMELGHATDAVFNEKNSKHKNGSIGILTDDLITRTDYYVHPLIMALVPFKNEQLYF